MNSGALQRARATLAALPESQRPVAVEAEQADLLARYVDAFERFDMDSLLLVLLHQDAVMSMPPYSLWLRGAENICRWMVLPGPSQCKGSVFVPVGYVNGVQALAQYKPDPAGGFAPWCLQVHEASGGRFSRLTYFLDTPRLVRLAGARAAPAVSGFWSAVQDVPAGHLILMTQRAWGRRLQMRCSATPGPAGGGLLGLAVFRGFLDLGRPGIDSLVSIDPSGVGQPGFVGRHGLASPGREALVQEVAASIRSQGLRTVRLAVVDQHGVPRGKMLSPEAAIAAMSDRLDFSGAIYSLDTGNQVFGARVHAHGGGFGIEEFTGFPDVMLVPRPCFLPRPALGRPHRLDAVRRVLRQRAADAAGRARAAPAGAGLAG